MRKDLITFKPIYSSLMSCDKDVESILKTLFVSSKPYSDILKKLLIINNKDCLDSTKTEYQQIINTYSLGDMIEKGYIRLDPKIARGTHEEIKAYILLSLDSFSPDKISDHYMNYNINFDIICHTDAWTLNDYKIRPLMICGYIDGILNSLTQNNKMIQRSHKSQIKLSGIGEYSFLGCQYSILNQELAMYTLSYYGKHFSQDIQQIGTVNNG